MSGGQGKGPDGQKEAAVYLAMFAAALRAADVRFAPHPSLPCVKGGGTAKP